MKAWDHNDWQQVLSNTQNYVRKRLCGDPCPRDLIEAWRRFYLTHEPLVHVLVARHGLAGPQAEGCARQIWIGMLVGLPKLHPPVTYDAFLDWLQQLAAVKADDCRVTSAPAADRSSRVMHPLGELAAPGDGPQPDGIRASSRLFEMCLVEERPVDDVAQALGLTAAQVARRQDDMLQKILDILIKLDL